MNKQFKTYKELVEEQARLKELARVQQVQIRQDLAGIREELEPVIHLSATLKKFVTRKSMDLIGELGVNLLANGLVRKVILSKAGWLTRLLVPEVVKNYASNAVHASGGFINKIVNLFSKNGKHEQEEQ